MPTTITLQPSINHETDTLEINAILGEGDDIALSSIEQLGADVPASDSLTLQAVDFTDRGYAYRVFAVTLSDAGEPLTPWKPLSGGGCAFTTIMPALGDDGPRFAICAVPVERDQPAPRPFVSGIGDSGGLPINVGSTGGPGPGSN